MKLWDHQERGIKAVRASFASGHRSVLAVAPTGSGKTEMSASMCESSVGLGNRVLWIVHSTELVDQAVNAFRNRGLRTGIIQADRPSDDGALLQVGTIQTLRRRQHDRYNLIIFDEAHLHLNASSKLVLDRMDHDWVLGLSATPTLLGGRSLGDLYTDLVTIVQPSELLGLGILVPPVIYAPNAPDLQSVPTLGGDYELTALETVCSTTLLVGSVPIWYGRVASGRPAILFAVNVSHSIKCRDALREAGYTAEHLDANTPKSERKELLARFKRGEINVLCNVQILTTGFDYPALGCIICARPTQSTALFIQMIGRGLRSSTGKSDCIVVDHSGNTIRHGFPHADRAWTLDQPRRKKKQMVQLSLRTCGDCFAVYLPSLAACPVCGASNPKQDREVKHSDGDLKLITEAPTPDEKRAAWEKMCSIAIYGHLSRYWVQDKFKKQFGHYLTVKWDEWPAELPIIPSIERSKVVRAMHSRGLPMSWAQDKLRKMGLSL